MAGACSFSVLFGLKHGFSMTNSTLHQPKVSDSQPPHTGAAAAIAKPVFQPDQQVKYLHLQAEVDTLLLELEALKQQHPVAANHHN